MGDPGTTRNPETYQIALSAHPAASKCARLALARRLKDWGLADLLDDAGLVLGELVCNAAKLGTPFTVVLTREQGSVLLKVVDKDKRLPVIKDADADSEDGRGMLLVDAISQSWGVSDEDGGRKGVWARCGRQQASGCFPQL